METKNGKVRIMAQIPEISLDTLEQNWIEQPRLMAEWGERMANAKIEMERTKNQLDELTAELRLEYRTNPPSGVKITESALTELVQSRPEIRALREKLLKTTAEYEHARAVVFALEHRKSALENLVKLYGSEYFSLPAVKFETEIQKQRVRQKIKNATKKQG